MMNSPAPELRFLVVAGRVASVNGAGVGLLGAKSPREVLNRLAVDFVPVRGRREFAARVRAVLKTGHGEVVSAQEWQRLDGSVWRGRVELELAYFRSRPAVEVRVQRERAGGAGEVTESDAGAAMGMKRYQTLELLEQSEERFRSLAQTAVDGVITANAEGRIVFWNEAAARMFGYTAEEIVGDKLDRLLPRNLRKHHHEVLVTSLRPEQETFIKKPREVVGVRKDGGPLPIELSMSTWQIGGEVFCTAIVRDITERKAAQAALQRAHLELEQRVTERTAELQQVIGRLEGEIASRQETELALRESEERYRTLFEASPVGIGITNREGAIFAFNRRMSEMTGYGPEQLARLSVRDLYERPAERERLLKLLEEHPRVDEYETRLKRCDGSVFPAAMQVNRVHLRGQEVLLTIVGDLTKRKEAEEHVQGITTLLELFTVKATREEYLKAVVRFLRDWSDCQCAGVRMFDSEGRLPFAAQVGFPAEFIKAEARQRLASAGCACMRVLQGRPKPGDFASMNARGSFFCNDLRRCGPAPSAGLAPNLPCIRAAYKTVAHVPIRYGDVVVGSVQIADNRSGRFNQASIQFIEAVAPLIGEALHRFRIEEELRESETRFRALFERHDAVMLLVEPANGAIVDANQAAARFYGYTRERLCTLSIQDLNILPADRVAAARRRALCERENFFVFSHRLANGDIRTVQVHSSPIQFSGKVLLFSIVHDITERKRLEKQILEISDMEKKRVGQDLHDSLGGSLTGLALLSKALAQTLAEHRLPEAQFAEEIVTGINNAVSQARSIARGLCPVGLGAFGLASGLQEYAATARKMFGIRCSFTSAGDLRLRDEVVASHLFRIVQEAVTNAVRHGQARQVRIHLAVRGDRLVLRVRDNGRGLPAHVEESPGMGLRTMRYRAEVIGAQLELKSRPGKGTVVTCVAPARATPARR